MNYYMPVRLFTGKGCFRQHSEVLRTFGSRCTIITGKHAAALCGALKDVTETLGSLGIAFSVFDGISQNPTVSSCIAAGAFAREHHAQFLLGIGGGSAMDAAKAAAVFAANPDLDEDAFYSKQWKTDPLPILLVGTTSGTGSEVTKVSVLTDSRGRKHSIHDDRLFSSVSFGDSRYTGSLSFPVTLTTGIDVLAHCTESYFSKKADELSRAFAVKGIRLLYEPLLAAAEGNALSPQQREQLYEASIFGGLSICITSTSFPHNVGYYLTETYHLPHGFACATFLPDLLCYEEGFDAAYSEQFYREISVGKDALLALTEKCLPNPGIVMADEEILAVLPRWENNSSVGNTRGEMNSTLIRQILKDKFMKKGETS